MRDALRHLIPAAAALVYGVWLVQVTGLLNHPGHWTRAQLLLPAVMFVAAAVVAFLVGALYTDLLGDAAPRRAAKTLCTVSLVALVVPGFIGGAAWMLILAFLTALAGHLLSVRRRPSTDPSGAPEWGAGEADQAAHMPVTSTADFAA